MKRTFVCLSILFCTLCVVSATGKNGIYKKGWIDFNKNGVKDIYEDPEAHVDDRIKDLLNQMTVEEKTCQMATLYGYGRVLEDPLPTDDWKNKLWKDGIANIVEQLNGIGKGARKHPELI